MEKRTRTDQRMKRERCVICWGKEEKENYAEEELDDQVKDDLEDEVEKRAFDGVLNKKGRRLLVEAVPAHKQSERPTFLQ